MKEEFNFGGQKPLQLCWACADLGIKPAMTNAVTSFLEKSQQRKVSKKRSKEQMRELGANKNKR